MARLAGLIPNLREDALVVVALIAVLCTALLG
jgi:hypothetical protein